MRKNCKVKIFIFKGSYQILKCIINKLWLAFKNAKIKCSNASARSAGINLCIFVKVCEATQITTFPRVEKYLKMLHMVKQAWLSVLA